jgi:hypothetical protein
MAGEAPETLGELTRRILSTKVRPRRTPGRCTANLSAESPLAEIAPKHGKVGIVVRRLAESSQAGLPSGIDPAIGTDGFAPEQERKLPRALKRVARRIQLRFRLRLLSLYVIELFLDCRHASIKGRCILVRYFQNHLDYRHDDWPPVLWVHVSTVHFLAQLECRDALVGDQVAAASDFAAIRSASRTIPIVRMMLDGLTLIELMPRSVKNRAISG